MNMGKDRRRKNSVCDTNPPSIIVSGVRNEVKQRRKSFPSKDFSRDRDFFVPDDVEEWVLPEYRSLFHHLFLREEDDSGHASADVAGSSSAASTSRTGPRRRKISPSGSTGPSEEDGPLCNFVKSFPAWLKKVLHISDNQEEQDQQQPTTDEERHVWLDEIPIEICDKLRHIHIYV